MQSAGTERTSIIRKWMGGDILYKTYWAMEAAYGSCQESIRKLNSLIHQALMIGCEIKSAQITTVIIMDAASEIELL